MLVAVAAAAPVNELVGKGLRAEVIDRHSQHRQERLGGAHARQVGRPAGAGDDHLQAAPLGRLGVGHEQVRRAVGGDDLLLERHAEALERRGGVAHRLPVGLRAHDQADQRLHDLPRGCG